MNFFEQQERAKRNTTKLVMLLCLAVLSLIAISTAAVVVILTLFGSNRPEAGLAFDDRYAQLLGVLDWHLVGTISLLVIAVVVLGSLFKQLQLRSGGKAVAESLDGRLINPHTIDFEERKILNVVEEMALASGIPTPPVYIIEDDAINAFAAGRTPKDAVIGITRGCIHLLKRSELQGVIAHEFSHIFHGDMRLNIRLVALLHGILLIGLIGYLLLRSAPMRRGSSNKDNSAIIMLGIGLALIVIGYAGTFFGNLIQAAVSRQREFLADASAVQFTRDPSGIANALKKIGGYSSGSQLQAANASEYSHMFFSQAVRSSLSALMATHPPLAQRIQRIEPDWNGEFPSVQVDPPTPGQEQATQVNSRRMGVLGSVAAATLARPSSQIEPLPSTAAQESIDAIGQAGARHIDYAQRTLAALDPELKSAARDPYTARALVYGLLLDHTPEVQTQQLAALRQQTVAHIYRAVLHLLDKLGQLDPRARLPLLGLCLPALKQLSPTQYTGFKACLDLLIAADKKTSLMEWALYRIVVQNIEPQDTGPRTGKLADYRADCELLLSALARAGSNNEAQAQAAFSAAASHLRLDGLQLQASAYASASVLEPAVVRLGRLAPLPQQTLLSALALAIQHDGVITVAEAELLRAIADSLHCPLPPFLDAADAAPSVS